MKIKKKFYWLIGGLIALLLDIIAWLLIYARASTGGENWGIIFWIAITSIPCRFFGSFLPGKTNIIMCNGYNLFGWFLFGALIGFIISKLKNKNTS